MLRNVDPGAVTLSPRREAFAQLYAQIGCGADAYEQAGYATSTRRSAEAGASKLVRNPKVAARVEQIRAELAERNALTVDSQIAKLETIFETHKENPKSAGAAVNAVKEQNELAGLRVQRHKVEAGVTVQTLPPLPPEAALAILERLMEEI